MEHKRFDRLQCPVARSLERVGEWWSILILRDAFYGLRRFDEFQESLGVPTNTLSRRLSELVRDGLLEKRLYQKGPARYEYVLTDRGRDFRPVLISMIAWGNRQFAPEGKAVRLEDVETGRSVEPILC